MASVSFFVMGEPKGQPRPRACIRGTKAGVFDPGTADGWKRNVWANCHNRCASTPKPVFTGAVKVALDFVFERPKAHRGAKGLKPTAPKFHTIKPDGDNLAKAVLDAITPINVWGDDCQVAVMSVTKTYGEVAGCLVTITEAR